MVIINNMYKYRGETVLLSDISYDEKGSRYCLCVPVENGSAESGNSFVVPEEHTDMLEPVTTGCSGCLFYSLREVKRRSVMEYKLYFSRESCCLYDDTVSTLDKPHRSGLMKAGGFCGANCPYFKEESKRDLLRLIEPKKVKGVINSFFKNRTLGCGTLHENGRDMMDLVLKGETAPWATRELDKELFKSTFAAFEGDRILVIGNFPVLLDSSRIEGKCISEWYEGVPPIAFEIDRSEFDYGMYIYALGHFRMNAAFADAAGKHAVVALPFVSFFLENGEKS